MKKKPAPYSAVSTVADGKKQPAPALKKGPRGAVNQPAPKRPKPKK